MKALRVFTVLSLAAGIAWGSQPVRVSDVRRELQVCYDAMARAIEAGDLPTVLNYLAADFRSVGADGQTADRQQIQARLRELLAEGNPVEETRYTVGSVRAEGSQATVLVTVSLAVRSAGPDGRPRKRVERGTRRDSWVKTAGGWHLKLSSVMNEAEAARGCKGNLAAVASAESAWALRHGAYTMLFSDLVGAPEGLARELACPLDGRAYQLTLDAPGPGDLSIACPNAADHARHLPVGTAGCQLTLGAPAP